ncbi:MULTISPECIES: acyl-CoA dehydrogenase family protein [unclassified Streptomyces]|uniref:acyl-CoA dehydrogenase family protein n=1 Tax=unclassified Streptomyces TaxID=2593676 RepID=UPI0033BBE602
MPKADLTTLAARLEAHLGDPHDPVSRMPFATILDHDEREEYPYPFVNLLRRWGVPEYALPSEQGGKAGDVEAEFNLVRLIARRDPTTATALVITNLAFMPVWIAGTDEQKRAVVEAVKHGTRLSWGLSERGYGSDLLAGTMSARKVDGGYLLSGEKWLIGNATWCDTVVVFARTGERPGPAAFSIFLLDKHKAPAGTVEELPRERLHGLRAMDISGVRLTDAFVPDSARIGSEGRGLEIALKATQTARAQISSIPMSAVDTGLRLTLDFTEGRILFGKPVSDIPYSRRQLTEVFADLLVADALTLGAVRGLQAAPEQASVSSSVTKYFIPTLLERTMSQLSMVLGARFFLRSHPHYGMFQKLLRDLLVANFADGNTVVNLRNLGHQLPALLATSTSADDTVRQAAAERAAVLYGMKRALPPYEPWRQELSSRSGRDDALLAAPDAVRRLRELADGAKEQEREWLLRAAEAADGLLAHAVSLHERCEALSTRLGREFRASAELFDLAKEYCVLHATAACVLTYVHSHGAQEDPLPSSAVLLLQLERLSRQLRPHEAVTDQAVVDEVMRVVRVLHRTDRLFSHWQFPLAKRTGDLAPSRY